MVVIVESERKCSVTVVGERKYNVLVADGCLRFHVRGRPINLYAPTAVMSNYQPVPGTSLPRQKLTLEWVYPCPSLLTCFTVT